MGLVWTAPGVVGAVAFIVAFAAALWVYFARPQREQNRILALTLAGEAIYMGGLGFTSLTDDARDAAAFYAVNSLGGAFVPPAFLLLLSTLDWPAARFLRLRGVRLALIGAAVLLPASIFLVPESYVLGVRTGRLAPWVGVDGPLNIVLTLAAMVVFALSLIASLWALRRAPEGTVARQHARAYLVAFGTRDTIYVAAIVGGALVPALTDLTLLVVPAASILFVALLAIGILRTQLFDLDLRLKWGLRRGSLAAVYLAAFFVVAELVQALATVWLGYLMGAIAAGLLLFALAPLQRFAERLSDTAFPDVRPSEAYFTYRKLEVYRAAVEGAAPPADRTPREREMLERLRAKLGVRPEDAMAIERDALGV